jgi:hypothetical protein
MSRIYNKHMDQVIRSVAPTTGFKKTEEFKKNLKIKKLEKELGKKPVAKKFNKGGRVGLKKGSFPDLSGDGKTTMKDILIGRGVIKNKKFDSPMAKAVKKKDKKRISAKHGSYKKASDGPQPVVYVTKAEDKKSEEILKKNKKRGFGSGLSRPKSQQV